MLFNVLFLLIASIGLMDLGIQAAPFVPVVAGLTALAASGSAVGAALGATTSHVENNISSKPRTDEEKAKIVKAGAAKGAIDGLLLLPGLALGPVTNMAGNKVAADILGIKDPKNKILEASAASGTPLLNLLQPVKGVVASKILENPDPARSFWHGEMDALVQMKDREEAESVQKKQ